jgi:hypothetical protein
LKEMHTITFMDILEMKIQKMNKYVFNQWMARCILLIMIALCSKYNWQIISFQGPLYLRMNQKVSLYQIVI